MMKTRRRVTRRPMNLRPFRRVLVANRGEIAVRVIRGCHERGIEAVAVASDVDRTALHARLADAVVGIGPAASSESYLRGEKLIAAARATGCDAVHPGYGFLSENAGFAQMVIDAGLVWIGPPPDAIHAMGSKTGARQRMRAAGVPCVPGTIEALRDDAEAIAVARDIGYPVMLKAASGGGGKGMRRVDDETSLADALLSAKSEAKKSFADDAVYIEKLVERPRHVEIQVFADGHGNVVHLCERDCSIQRRNQKVIEESPCPVLTPDVRAAMGAVAVRAAEAVGYVGAGTCEFLLSEDERTFYFLEMNTRLQVEHPITELVVGMDLVHAQLRVAAGERLWFAQSDVVQTGHAIECRIYAEDVTANFRPSPGPLLGYREPGGPWTRVDSGVVEGTDVPIHYDPMVAKLICWGSNREEAIGRTRRALEHYRIVGIPTSIPFFTAVLDDPGFKSGKYSTAFITPEWLAAHVTASDEALETAMIAAAIARLEADSQARPAANAPAASSWRWGHRWNTLRKGTR
jgi:acetyl-CoA carboxylase biotin carboxylase subunit